MAKHKSKVQSKGELDLSIGPETNASFDGGSHNSESSAARGRQRLSGLELPGGCSQRRSQQCGRGGKIRQIEYVEDFCTKLDVPVLGERELLVQDQVELTELWPTQEVSRYIAERSRLGYCKGGRVKKRPVLVEVWIDSRYQVRPSCGTRRTAERRIDDSRASVGSAGEDVSGCVCVNDIRPGNKNVDR